MLYTRIARLGQARVSAPRRFWGPVCELWRSRRGAADLRSRPNDLARTYLSAREVIPVAPGNTRRPSSEGRFSFQGAASSAASTSRPEASFRDS
jgi:hypothetical protein